MGLGAAARSPSPRERFVQIDAPFVHARDVSSSPRFVPGWLEAVAAPKSNSARHRAPSRCRPSKIDSISWRLSDHATRTCRDRPGRDVRLRSLQIEFFSVPAAPTADSTSRMQRHGKTCARGRNAGSGCALGTTQTGTVQVGPGFCLAVDAWTALIDVNVQWSSGMSHVCCFSPFGVVTLCVFAA
jgi:hypothetical protein